jgi:hypothetical protein
MPGWPPTGQIRLLEISKKALSELRPADRPKNEVRLRNSNILG